MLQLPNVTVECGSCCSQWVATTATNTPWYTSLLSVLFISGNVYYLEDAPTAVRVLDFQNKRKKFGFERSIYTIIMRGQGPDSQTLATVGLDQNHHFQSSKFDKYLKKQPLTVTVTLVDPPKIPPYWYPPTQPTSFSTYCTWDRI